MDPSPNQTPKAPNSLGDYELPATLFIAGASARAAAFSAIRAGIQPVCADLFADQDLQAVADVTRIEDYPADLTTVAASIPQMPWMYTGALENHPKILAKINPTRRLLGNGPALLPQIRDPQQLARLLLATDLPALQVRDQANPPQRDGSWLLKPHCSAGGQGIQVWDENSVIVGRRGGYYFQRRAEGIPYSALFLAIENQAILIGIAQQLTGMAEFHAAAFAYCGSIGPVKLPPAVENTLQAIGETLVASAGLRGVFGCDFILDGSKPCLVEVNPRYTASVEVYERAWGLPLLAWHCLACEEPGTTKARAEQLQRQLDNLRRASVQYVGKSILFASQQIVSPSLGGIFPKPSDRLEPPTADLPPPSTNIAAGHPICTVYSKGETEMSCQTQLLERIRCIKAAIRCSNS